MIWLVFVGITAGAGLVWSLVVMSKKTGQQKSQISQLQESREQSEDANKVESDIDRLSITDRRDRMHKSWSKQQLY